MIVGIRHDRDPRVGLEFKLGDMGFAAERFCLSRADMVEGEYPFDEPPDDVAHRDGPWIGVDFDGTLATHGAGQFGLGDPVPAMVERVRAWLRQGKTVKVVTARVGPGNTRDEKREARAAIQDWCSRHVGAALPVTCCKDFGMLELWDDRAVGVVPNTGATRAFAATVEAPGYRRGLYA
jgi:hypothetical protein